jgi:phospholipase/carboxylesterase
VLLAVELALVAGTAGFQAEVTREDRCGDNAVMNDPGPTNTHALLDSVAHETGPAPAWTVLWLHGLGADGNDFAPIVPELLVRDGVRRDWPAIRFVFPHAPVRAVTINGGARMRAWYDIRDMDLNNRADHEGVAESVIHVDALIAREAERGVPANRVLLIGFSQGGAITLAAGLARSTPLAGLVGLSTYLPMPPDRAAAALQPGAASQPLFMGHGQFDQVVPFAGGEISAQAMRELGFDVQWHRYPMQHAVCAEEIRDLGDWMDARFATG